MKTSTITKKVARCASLSDVRPALACVLHSGDTITATDSFIAVQVKVSEIAESPVLYSAKPLRTYPNGTPVGPCEVDASEYPNVNKVYEENEPQSESIGTYNIGYLRKMLDALETGDCGCVEILHNTKYARTALLFRTKNGSRGMVMPLNR